MFRYSELLRDFALKRNLHSTTKDERIATQRRSYKNMESVSQCLPKKRHKKSVEQFHAFQSFIKSILFGSSIFAIQVKHKAKAQSIRQRVAIYTISRRN